MSSFQGDPSTIFVNGPKSFEILANFSILAAAEYGKGRVVAVGDSFYATSKYTYHLV